MNEMEFISFVHLNMNELYRGVKSMGYEQTMMLKNELQRAMSKYSVGKQGQFDRVQEKALAMMMKLEKWIKIAFIERELKYLKKNCPQLTDAGRKSLARESWEKYNRKMSY